MKAAGTDVVVAVGTTRGGFLLSSNSSRKTWRRSSPFLKGESVNNFAYSPTDGKLYAATLTEGMFVSKNLGKTWTPINNGLHVRKAWTVAVDPKDPSILYAGTHYGHLFRSGNGGEVWEEVTGLFTAPKRNEWGIDWALGTTGLCIHTVRIDPRNNKRLYIVVSGNGPYRSDDRGETWRLMQNGVLDTCPVGANSNAPDSPKNEKTSQLEKHLQQVHVCTHKLVISPRTPNLVYQQNHCGVYRSQDGGERWTDVSPSDSLRHGFAIALVENGDQSLYVVPAFQNICKEHNSCVRGELAAYRTQSGGSKWEKLSTGLPKKVHNCVLRDSMAADQLQPSGLYFGTTTGEVYGSNDGGDTWSDLVKGAGRVQGLVSFTTN